MSFKIHQFLASAGDLHTVKVESGTAFLVWMNEGAGGGAVGFLIQDARLLNASSDLSLWAEKVLKPEAQGKVYRLFASEMVLNRMDPILKKVGLKSGKCVAFHDAVTTLQFIPKESRVRVEKPIEKLAEKATQVPAIKNSKKVKVLVVDDSETIRKLLARVFTENEGLECVGTVEHPRDVFKAIDELKPDVITLDIHMPEMDGVELLKRILPRYRLPCVMISSLSRDDGDYVLDALEAGAVDYIQKPSMAELKQVAPLICEKVRAAGQSHVVLNKRHLSKVSVDPSQIDRDFLILIGSSTGGTEALREVLTRLPAEIPPILIVQHIPAVFSKAFADRMNTLCPFEVREAVDGDLVLPGVVLIAPGGKQMRVKETQGVLKILIDDSEPVNRHKPSVDVLFHSAVLLKKKKMVAGILTGMGADGARGLLALKNSGVSTFAQDEASCVVYGMPKEAAKIGAVDKVLPLDEMPSHILNAVTKKQRKIA